MTSYTTAEAPSAPYFPSGFKPKGEPFTLPPFKFKQQPAAASQNPLRLGQPHLEYGAPVSPQLENLPPANNNPVTSVTPLHQQVSFSKNGQSSVLRPEDQYVPPRPFSENQSIFNPNTLYNTPSSEQSLPLQTSSSWQIQDQHNQVVQKKYNAPVKSDEHQFSEQQNFRPQVDLELNSQYGAPTTPESSNVSTQDNFDEQRLLLSNQQRVESSSKNNNSKYESARIQQSEGRNPSPRRLIQRRRKQQRGDQGSRNFDGNEQNRPAGTYGVPAVSTLKSVNREPESTTRPFKRIRTTTDRAEQVSR